MMNERIKELEKQCYGYASLHDDTVVFDKEKFAELIVRECCYQVVQYQSRVYANKEHLVVDRLEQLHSLIKQHFVVEE